MPVRHTALTVLCIHANPIKWYSKLTVYLLYPAHNTHSPLYTCQTRHTALTALCIPVYPAHVQPCVYPSYLAHSTHSPLYIVKPVTQQSQPFVYLLYPAHVQPSVYPSYPSHSNHSPLYNCYTRHIYNPLYTCYTRHMYGHMYTRHTRHTVYKPSVYLSNPSQSLQSPLYILYIFETSVMTLLVFVLFTIAFCVVYNSSSAFTLINAILVL